MARKTFGKSGEVIQVTDDTLEVPRQPVASEPTGSESRPAFTVIRDDDASEHGNESGVADVADATFIDPANAARPKRGRPRGSRTPRKPAPQSPEQSAASAQILTANLEKVVYNLHAMGAGFLSQPELRITQDEAALLAEALKEVAAAYDFTALLNPRTQAWVDLGIACTTVYGVKIITMMHAPKGPRIVSTPPQPMHHVQPIQ